MALMQTLRRLIPVLGLFIFLAGCSDNGTSPTHSTPVQTRSVSHAMGETEVPERPKRIVVLSVEATETLLALGIQPVGAVKSNTANPADTWFAHIRDDMEGTTVVGTEGQVNLEAVASLRPDLILGLKSRQEGIYPQLSAIAPTVYADQFHGMLRENLLLMSDAVNRKHEGMAIIDELDHTISQLSGRLSQQGYLEQEVAVIRFQVTGARYYYNDSFAAGLINDLGFARPQLHDNDGFAEPLTLERIPEADADIQFYFTYASTDPEQGQENTQNWLDHPMWQGLRASKNGQIYLMDNDIWNKSYGILSGRLVLQNIEDALLNQDS